MISRKDISNWFILTGSQRPKLVWIGRKLCSILGAYVTRIQVSDADSSDYQGFGAITYSLEPTGVFSVDENTGVIILNDALDYETQKTWQLVTLARDGGGLETRCHVVVEVEDANEAAPVFQQPTDDDLELLINSEEAKDTYLMTARAIDPDFNPETASGNKMEYSLTGGKEIISINSLSGEVFLNKSAVDILDDDKTFRVIITVIIQHLIIKCNCCL